MHLFQRFFRRQRELADWATRSSGVGRARYTEVSHVSHPLPPGVSEQSLPRLCCEPIVEFAGYLDLFS
jgi:hypothetical protein